MAETRWTNNSARYDASEREGEDLGQVQGVFYRVLHPNEVPFWMREDAERHMTLLCVALEIPTQEIEWFVPALFDEVPESVIAQLEKAVEAGNTLLQSPLRSDEAGVAPACGPVYFFFHSGVQGMAASRPTVAKIYLRADMERVGSEGLGAMMAYELKARQQTYKELAGDMDGVDMERDEIEAQRFKAWYDESILMGRNGFLVACPECGEGGGPFTDLAQLRACGIDVTHIA